MTTSTITAKSQGDPLAYVEGKSTQMYFDAFGSVQLFIACSVNVAASGVFLYARKTICWLLGTSEEALEAKSIYFSFLSPQHMLRGSLSPGRDRACRHCWISSLGATRESGGFTFRADPFFSPPTPWQSTCLTFFIKIKEKHVLCSNLFAPWQETFADAGDGDGGDHLE